MMRPLKKPTRIVPRETETRRPRQALNNKAKPSVGPKTPANTLGCPSLSKVPNTRRSNQKSSIESQAAIPMRNRKQLASVNLTSGFSKGSEDFESKIRSALSLSSPRRDKISLSNAESSKSVKFDPAILFFSHPAHKESSTENSRVQASVEAILSCDLNEQKVLHHFIKALIKHDGEKNEPAAKGGTIGGILNPRASSFQTTSSPKYQHLPTGVKPQQHASTPHLPLRRRFHPRSTLDPSTFDSQNLVRQENPSLVQPSVSMQTTSCLSSVSSKKSNYHHRPLENLPKQTFKMNIESSIFGNSRGPSIPEEHTFNPIAYQNAQLVDPPDESESGREALAIDPTWAKAILNNFAQKYPMTGLYAPGLAVIVQRKRSAEVQQMLEYVIMQKKEMAALAGGLLDSGYGTEHIKTWFRKE